MANNTILLTGDMGAFYDEGRAGATITPGMLIELTPTTGLLRPHATAGGAAQKWFAVEDAYRGATIDNDYDAVTHTLVRYHKARPGERLQLILVDGENAAVGSPLSSNGDGKMQVATGTEVVIAHSEEALDLTAAGADGRIKAQIR